MTSDLFPYVNLRRRADGTIRPRFAPGPRERMLGYAGEDLRHAGGAWFTLDEVARFAAARLAEILQARIDGKRTAVAPVAPRGKTVADLLDDFLASADVERLAAKTRSDYAKKANTIRWRPRRLAPTSAMPGDSLYRRRIQWRAAKPAKQPEPIALSPARALDAPTVKDFFEYLVKARGLASARGAIAVLSSAFKWGRLSAAWRLGANPCHDLGLPSPATDVRIYEAEEIVALRLMGDATGDQSIVDAIVLGLLSDQRPTDILAFTGGAIVQEGPGFPIVRLIQSKTGKRVALPALRVLRERLALMVARRRANGWTCDELVVDDRTGQRFTERDFNTRWRALIARTVAGDARLGLTPMPSLTGKKFKHLRKTTFTWLHRAGNDLLGISSVSGHALSSMPQMAKHYLELDYATAVTAMTKLDTWMDETGVKL